VATLRLAGRTIEQIRSDLARSGVEVSHGTVASDLAEIKKAWQREYAATYEEHCAKQLAQIEAGLTRAGREYLGGGDASHGHIFVRLLREKARLLGLDSPMRIEAQIRVTEYNTRLDQEIEALLSQFPGMGAIEAASEVHAEGSRNGQEPDPIQDAISGLPLG